VALEQVPSYERTGCPACAKFPEPITTDKGNLVARCTNCEEQMTKPAPASGFQSPIIHHHHFRMTEGRQSMTVVCPAVCAKCYLEQFLLKYPDAKPPDFEKQQEY